MSTCTQILDDLAVADEPGVDLEHGDARGHRDEILRLYERTGREDLVSQFDWYYRSEEQPAPTTWFLRSHTNQLCGIVSVSVRKMRWEGTPILAGVAGNLLIDRKQGLYYGASTLVSAMKSLVVQGDLDVLLGIPNDKAYPVFARAGFREVDRWATHASLYHSHDILPSDFRVMRILAIPFVGLAALTCRAIGKQMRTSVSGLAIRSMTEDELSGLPLETWLGRTSVISMSASVEYLKSRYLRCPGRAYSVVAVVDDQGRACGCLCLRHSPRRIWITDCFVDRTRISEATAVLALCGAWKPGDQTIWVAHLRSSEMSAQLSAAGLIPVSSRFGGYPDYPLVAFWKPEHPLGGVFSQPCSWQILPGFNDI